MGNLVLKENESVEEVSRQAFDRSLSTTSRKSRYLWSIGIVSLVVTLSFLYGLKRGFDGSVREAFASQMSSFSDADVSSILQQELKLSFNDTETKVFSLGSALELNGKQANLFSIVSTQSPSRLALIVKDNWKEAGLEVFDASRGGGAAVVAADRATKARYSALFWSVPPLLRASSSGGYPTQGSIGRSDVGQAVSETSIPGVPVMAGAEPGSLISASDPGGRSYTATYSVPQSVEEAAFYYRTELSNRGWHELSADLLGDGKQSGAFLNFRQQNHEITLLISELPQTAQSGMKSVMTIIKKPVARGLSNNAGSAEVKD